MRLCADNYLLPILLLTTPIEMSPLVDAVFLCVSVLCAVVAAIVAIVLLVLIVRHFRRPPPSVLCSLRAPSPHPVVGRPL